jgi:hypothetical protein
LLLPFCELPQELAPKSPAQRVNSKIGERYPATPKGAWQERDMREDLTEAEVHEACDTLDRAGIHTRNLVTGIWRFASASAETRATERVEEIGKVLARAEADRTVLEVTCDEMKYERDKALTNFSHGQTEFEESRSNHIGVLHVGHGGCRCFSVS